MAREQSLIWEGAHPYRLSVELRKDNHVTALKDTVVTSLRELFADHPIYTYVERQDEVPGPDFERTQIVITDVYTYDVKFLPAITMRLDSSSNYAVSFNQNALGILDADGFPLRGVINYVVGPDGKFIIDPHGRKVPNFMEYAGGWDNNITLLVSAEDTVTREEVVSHLAFAMQHLLRDVLYTRGVFIKRTSVGGEQESPYANDYIYQQSVSCEVYSEWHHRIPVPDLILESWGFDIGYVNELKEVLSQDAFGIPGTNENSLFVYMITALNDYFEFHQDDYYMAEWILTQTGINYLQRIYAFEQIAPYVSGSSFEELTPEDFLAVLIIVPIEGSLTRTRMSILVDNLKAEQTEQLPKDRLDEIQQNVIEREEAALTALA